MFLVQNIECGQFSEDDVHRFVILSEDEDNFGEFETVLFELK